VSGDGLHIDEGEVYFAPVGTAPPTSKAALMAAGWQFIVQPIDESARREDERLEAAVTGKHWSLDVTHQLPQVYEPNRATRRAAARAAKQGRR
jgi:hypothetical protein